MGSHQPTWHGQRSRQHEEAVKPKETFARATGDVCPHETSTSVSLCSKPQSRPESRGFWRAHSISDQLATDVEMSSLLNELRIRERQLAQKAHDMKVGEVSVPVSRRIAHNKLNTPVDTRCIHYICLEDSINSDRSTASLPLLPTSTACRRARHSAPAGHHRRARGRVGRARCQHGTTCYADGRPGGRINGKPVCQVEVSHGVCRGEAGEAQSRYGIGAVKLHHLLGVSVIFVLAMLLYRYLHGRSCLFLYHW